jgi:hypothetical protein
VVKVERYSRNEGDGGWMSPAPRTASSIVLFLKGEGLFGEVLTGLVGDFGLEIPSPTESTCVVSIRRSVAEAEYARDVKGDVKGGVHGDEVRSKSEDSEDAPNSGLDSIALGFVTTMLFFFRRA